MVSKQRLNRVFIVGVGRSGTSLLQSMFAAHSAVAFLPETAFVRLMVAKKKLQNLHSKSGESGVIEFLSGDKNFARTGLDAADLVCIALKRSETLDVAFYLAMQNAIMERCHSWIGDKDPRAIEYIPLLKVIVPDSHVIHICRDPRDILVSKKKAKWSRRGHVWKHIFANRVQMRIGRSQGRMLFGDRYHELRYEDLLEDPEGVLRRLCSNIGIRFEAKMLYFGDAAKKLVSKEELSWKKETLGPLLSKNSGKWRMELKAEEIRLTERCCAETMEDDGYACDDHLCGLGLRGWIWMASGYFLILIATNPYLFFQKRKIRKACL